MSGGGQLRLSGGRRLLSPGGRTARPTTSRVREAVMNILAPHLQDCRWLDLCSGSGVMGCEALQRGARCVVAVDQDPQCIRVSRSNLSVVAESRSPAPEIRTERRELISWLRKGWSQEPFDIVYFDPPYDQGLYEPCLIALAEGNWLHQDSLVVCEHRSNLNPEPGSDWTGFGSTPLRHQQRDAAQPPRALPPRRYWFHAATNRPISVTGIRPRTMPQSRGSIIASRQQSELGRILSLELRVCGPAVTNCGRIGIS